MSWSLLLMLFRKKKMSARSTKLSYAWSLVLIIFGFRRVSLAEYILVLRVYSLLLQMAFFIRAYVSTVSTQQVTKTRSRAWSLFILSECFCGMWSASWYLYLNSCVWVKLFASTTLQDLVCNNYDPMCLKASRPLSGFRWLMSIQDYYD